LRPWANEIAGGFCYDFQVIPNDDVLVRRRRLGALACLSPFAIVFFSILFPAPGRSSVVAVTLVAIAGLVAVLNGWISLGRGLVYKCRYGTLAGFRSSSGFPLIGTILTVLALISGFGSIFIAIAGATILLLDTGGSLWLLVVTWQDDSLWSTPGKS
jgi:hypothetical protein